MLIVDGVLAAIALVGLVLTLTRRLDHARLLRAGGSLAPRWARAAVFGLGFVLMVRPHGLSGQVRRP